MPIYEFKCPKCGNRCEILVLQKNYSEPTCHNCDIPMKKVPSPFAYKADRTAERERNIIKLASDYLKDGKVQDAARFLNKAREFVRTDNIKRASDTLNRVTNKE